MGYYMTNPIMTPENRRFPRIPHVTSRQIVHLDQDGPKKNFILTENLSASGIKFTTHNHLEEGLYFLIYLNDQLMKEIRSLYEKKQSWVKAGDYYLAKVVWVTEIRKDQSVFEIGAAFVKKDNCRTGEIETLTDLMNISMMDNLPKDAVLA